MSLALLVATASVSYVPQLADAVVYEANLRAEGPRGGFRRLTNRLDSIRTLGVNVLWLMPIHPVGKVRSAGGLGSPYAVADYDGINPEFGTPAEFRALVREAHRRRIAVILDWVPNHTAWDHPWVKSHPEWYTRDENGTIQIPAGTNWQDVADLNYDVPEMRQAMIGAMRNWITRYGVDGFRCDTADYVPYRFWKEAVPQLRASVSRPLFMLAEGFRADHYEAGFDLTYGWNFHHRLREIFKGAKATELALGAASEARDVPSGARRLRFTANHDTAAWEGSSREFFATARGARTAFAVTVLYGGTPLIYAGQEVDYPDRVPIFERSTINWNRDPGAKRWIAGLFRLQRQFSSVRTGVTKDWSDEDAIVFRRSSQKDEVLVLANPRARTLVVNLPAEVRGLWKDGDTGKPVRLGEWRDLEPYGHRVYVRQINDARRAKP